MSIVPEKFGEVIEEGVVRVLARAEDARGLSSAEVRPRIEAGLAKYLFKDAPDADRNAVREFLDEIRSDDLCLIIACERGNEAAWEDLVTNFDATVKSAARKMAANAEDAEDLAGSIWAELYGLRLDAEGNKKSKLAYYSGRGSLGGWLRAVVSQLAIDEFRKQSKFVQIEEDRDFENLAEESSNHAGNDGVVQHAENPEDLLTEKRSRADVAKALAAAIENLEDEDRLILKLYYFEDQKLKDIAATFGYHEATASRRLARLQGDIRKAVEKELKREHGWTDTEVRRHLTETAENLGISFEKMLAVILIFTVVQEIWRTGVL